MNTVYINVEFGLPSDLTSTAVADRITYVKGLDDRGTIIVINAVEGLLINEMAELIAGDIAGASMFDSITFDVFTGDELDVRLTHEQTVEALKAGALVMTHDGEKIKVEKGITVNCEKIRAVSTEFGIYTDIAKTVNEKYIGKFHNNRDGQVAVATAIKAYLERLETANVLQDPDAYVDPNYESKDDYMFAGVEYDDTDSLERVFLTVLVK